jgi:hypothetical protein
LETATGLAVDSLSSRHVPVIGMPRGGGGSGGAGGAGRAAGEGRSAVWGGAGRLAPPSALRGKKSWSAEGEGVTEEQWLRSAGPGAMLEHLYYELNERKVPHPPADLSPRKLRLLVVACGRAIDDHSADQRTRDAVDAGERFADGCGSRADLDSARSAARAAQEEAWQAAGRRETAPSVAAGVALAACAGGFYATKRALEDLHRLWEPEGAGRPDARYRRLSQVVRCLFGNPFRPVAFDLRWRTADAVGLARAIYEDRAFDRLPLLADALMDAGCGDDQLLVHCRSDGPHVRGCVVVDLVLGKV